MKSPKHIKVMHTNHFSQEGAPLRRRSDPDVEKVWVVAAFFDGPLAALSFLRAFRPDADECDNGVIKDRSIEFEGKPEPCRSCGSCKARPVGLGFDGSPIMQCKNCNRMHFEGVSY